MGCRKVSRSISSLIVAGLWLVSTSASAQTFSDQTATGVAFSHHADWTDEMAFGAGAAWGDYDGDGDLDLYVADRGGANALFRNDGVVGFVDVAADLGLEVAAADSTGALWGDYDNDGDQDLYVMNRGDNLMFRNEGSDGGGGWVFQDVTAALGVEAFGRATAAVYGDYDNDGWLDLYVSNHGYEFTKPVAGGADTHSDRLFHNADDGSGGRLFVDVTADAFGTDVLFQSIAHSAAFFDYDNDGDPDIYVANEVMGTDPKLFGVILWRNDGSDGAGGWVFTDVTGQTGVDLRSHPMGIAVGDYNNDGWLDFAMSDTGANLLYQNNAGVFSEVAAQAGVDRPVVPGAFPINQVGWGIVFADFDLDGSEDLYVATGGLGNQTRPQPNPLFINNFDPLNNTFTDVTDLAGADDPQRGRTVVKGDYDLDGDEDLYVVNYDDEAVLLRNDQVGGDYLVLDLLGLRSNRDAIGARVKLTSALVGDQYRVVQSGATTTGSHDLALFYGVSGEAVVDAIEIGWPSGTRTVRTAVAVNQRLEIRELTLVTGDASLEVDEFGRLSQFETAVGNHLGDFRLFLSVDDGPPARLGPDDFEVVQAVEIVDQMATSRLVSIDGTLQVDLTAELSDPGSQLSVKVRVRLTNLSGQVMAVKHFAYYDWNIGGAADDQGKFLSSLRIIQRDPAALPGRNFYMSASRPFDHWEIDTAPTLLDKLEQAAQAIDLRDGDSPLAGDLTTAIQFDATIDSGGSWQVVHNFIY